MVAAAPSGWARWLHTLLTRPPVVARLVLWVTWADWRDPVSRTWLETLPNRNAELMIAKLRIITAGVVAQSARPSSPQLSFCTSARPERERVPSRHSSRRCSGNSAPRARPRRKAWHELSKLVLQELGDWATCGGQIERPWPGAMSKV
jgi:hypothetical protein